VFAQSVVKLRAMQGNFLPCSGPQFFTTSRDLSHGVSVIWRHRIWIDSGGLAQEFGCGVFKHTAHLSVQAFFMIAFYGKFKTGFKWKSRFRHVNCWYMVEYKMIYKIIHIMPAVVSVLTNALPAPLAFARSGRGPVRCCAQMKAKCEPYFNLA
jgi:hypothetical protein